MAAEANLPPEGAEQWKRIGPAEHYPAVGSIEDKFKLAGRVFDVPQLDAMKSFVEGGIDRRAFARRIIPNSGDNSGFDDSSVTPQEFEIELRSGDGRGGSLELEFIGGWEDADRLRGVPLLATFTGQLWRATSAEKWEAGEPIAEAGGDVRENQPIAFAMAGKNQRWLYRLRGRDFPKGARVVSFSPDFDPETGSLNVQPGTEFCRVEKIE